MIEWQNAIWMMIGAILSTIGYKIAETIIDKIKEKGVEVWYISRKKYKKLDNPKELWESIDKKWHPEMIAKAIENESDHTKSWYHGFGVGVSMAMNFIATGNKKDLKELPDIIGYPAYKALEIMVIYSQMKFQK